MKTCPRCGSEVRPTARFCPRCGAPQPAEEAQPTPPAYTDQNRSDAPVYQPNYYPPVGTPAQPTPPTYTEQNRSDAPVYQPNYYPPVGPPAQPAASPVRRINPWLAAGIGAAVLVCLITTAYFLITRLPGFIAEQEQKQVRRLIEEGIGVIATDAATQIPRLITQAGTALQSIQTTLPALATSEPAQTLANLPTSLGFTIPTGTFSSFLNPETATPSPNTLMMEWYNSSETYEVEIKNGKVVAGTAQTNFNWTTVEGSLDGDTLIVLWKTTQRTDCQNQMTQTYRVEAQRMELIQSVDRCGNLTTYNDQYYTRKQ